MANVNKVNEPIKLQNNLHLYSGDVISINNSYPLLIEIVDDQKQIVKLRDVESNQYLSRKKMSLITLDHSLGLML